MKKTSKPQAAERLAVLKQELNQQIKEQEGLLERNLSSLYQNSGNLLLSSAIRTVKNSLPGFAQSLLSLVGFSPSAPLGFKSQAGEQQNGKLKSSLSVLLDTVVPFLLPIGIQLLKSRLLNKKTKS